MMMMMMMMMMASIQSGPPHPVRII